MKFPFPAVAAAFRERRTVRRRIPHVTEDDVDRIVRRDFPKEQFEAAMEALAEYGKQAGARRAAVLQLSNGRLDALRRHVEAGKRDYRDVLAAGEYPEYAKATVPVRQLSKDEQQRVIDADWKQ